VEGDAVCVGVAGGDGDALVDVVRVPDTLAGRVGDAVLVLLGVAPLERLGVPLPDAVPLEVLVDDGVPARDAVHVPLELAAAV